MENGYEMIVAEKYRHKQNVIMEIEKILFGLRNEPGDLKIRITVE